MAASGLFHIKKIFASVPPARPPAKGSRTGVLFCGLTKPSVDYIDIAVTEDFETDLDMATLIGKVVVVTGTFSGRYTRQAFITSLNHIGIKVADIVSKKIDVLIVANEASKHWATHNAGRKLLLAHELRTKHGVPLLVTERVAIKALDNFNNA
jgi:NAD-dependent DNA ligase